MRAGVIAPTTPWVFAKASKFLGSWRVARGDISHAGLGGMTGGDLAGDGLPIWPAIYRDDNAARPRFDSAVRTLAAKSAMRSVARTFNQARQTSIGGMSMMGRATTPARA
jgi:hypothetical protein